MTRSLRVFVSSTSEDLKPYRAAARDVILDMGWQFVGMEHFGADPDPIVVACRRRVAECDLVVLIQAFRRGWVPTPELGGDGKTSITAWEVRAADESRKPVLAFLASGKWPGELWDQGADLAWVKDLRGHVNRMALFFDPEDASLKSFRALLRQELARHKERLLADGATALPVATGVLPEIRLRPAPKAPDLPPEPYPLLDPYRHPATFAGRDREVGEMRRLLALDKLILCVHAPSGAGKSSVLLAGLVPSLLADGVPVAFERRPWDPGIARRLAADLLELPESTRVPDDDSAAFADWIRRAHDLSGKPPVLVIDQLDDVLRSERDKEASLARLGPLLAANSQRLPGLQGPPCRWLLCYRQEFHGEVMGWLEDALAPARRAGGAGLDEMPSDLSGSEILHAWELPVMGAAVRGAGPETATGAFLEAIEKPLRLQGEPGRRRYPIGFPRDGARGLAEAFARARQARPGAPLVPELQVVLRHLIDRAARDGDGATVEVPSDPAETDELIADALEAHVRRALTEAFAGADRLKARQGRSRAFIALLELADAEGRRGEGMPEEEILKVLDEGGRDVLEKLASARMRVVVKEDRAGIVVVSLSHDCLAAVVSRLERDESLRAGLDLDPVLVSLRRFVTQRADLWHRSKDRTALDLDRRTFRTIAGSPGAFLLDDDRRRWWEACRLRRRERGRRRLYYAAAAWMLLGLGGWLLARSAVRLADRDRLEDQLQGTDPRLSFRALGDLVKRHSYDPEQLLARLVRDEARAREWFTVGPAGRAGLRPVEPEEFNLLAERLPSELLTSRRVFGAMAGAIEDLAARHAGKRDSWLRVREEVRSRFIEATRLRPPTDADQRSLNPWVDLAGGEFLMGSPEGIGGNSERPAHLVRLSPFSIQTHEVTNEEYRRFDPDHAPDAPARDPVTGVTWYDAMAYCAWLGGSLPTEAQWEFAARGEEGREYPWGKYPPTREHANYGVDSFAGGVLEPVGSHPKGATPEGVHDLAGNVWEWCRDWYGPYEPEGGRSSGERAVTDPPGPLEGRSRVLRGGAFLSAPGNLRAACRDHLHPEVEAGYFGFRCVAAGAARGQD
jgi:formylglycine-generating enzyme required for sulfatase activity